jgi:ATP-dependent RNA helicase DeaD
VGAIANEAELESRYIGHIEIFDDFTTVDLPAGMPEATLRELRNAWVCQQRLAIERLKGAGSAAPDAADKSTQSRPKPRSKPAPAGARGKGGEKSSAASRRPPHAADSPDGPGSRGERKSEPARRPGPRPAKGGVRKPGVKPAALKGKKKNKLAGNKPLKKRLTLKKGDKPGA